MTDKTLPGILRPLLLIPLAQIDADRVRTWLTDEAAKFAALAELLRARQRAGLTQAELAERMGVSQPVVARIEGSIGSRKHAPSLATLRKYAEACGQRLEIRLVPKEEHAT